MESRQTEMAQHTCCLRSDDVHIWYVDLQSDAIPIDALASLLSEDEQGRAARFHFDRHRRRFIVRRGALRVLLGRYANSPAGSLRFLYAPRGKPELSACTNPETLYFNSSHSHELCVIAVTRVGPVGVDVEYLRPMRDAEEIARRHFSESEIRDLMAVEPSDRERAFFTCWTRKEAYVKAVGDGLSIPLDGFEVTFLPEDPPRMYSESTSMDLPIWSLFELVRGDPYVGALALEHPAPRILAREFDPELVLGQTDPGR